MDDLDALFGPEGALARHLAHFRPRPGQAAMARAVAAALQERRSLVAEAGTGTGKTLAYLAPAILSGRKVIVSTATKTLQDQLFHKDLPLLRDALERPFRSALLKGRSNYLCLYRLDHALGFGAGQGGAEARALESIRRWAATTGTGDIAEVTEVPESSPFWPQATSTADNCLGQDCPRYRECFLVKARRAALEADILVINHHLLWADWTLRSDGFGELLPEAGVVVVDEAHQLLDSAQQFLGLSLSSRQLVELARDIAVEQGKVAPEATPVTQGAKQLEHRTGELRLRLGGDPRREAWHTLEQTPGVPEGLAELQRHLVQLQEDLKTLAILSKGMESCYKRCGELAARLESFLDQEQAEMVRWAEIHRRGFVLNRTPLTIAEAFRQCRHASRAVWVFTSATLSVGGDFTHFVDQCGLEEAECQSWDSPFDYRHQALLYLPEAMPDPSTAGYTQAVVRAALPVLEASRGRAFLLFTSHQALLEAATALAGRLPYPLFVQGRQPKTALLEAFKRAGNGVLLGTGSFWEGVDVPGPALSCVIIDKLPFASPTDPVLSARLDNLRRAGRNPFLTLQLPIAVIALKQGIGRLLRDANDRGVLMLCDPRLLSRSYGRRFLDSLPEIPRTRSLAEVQSFFAASPPEDPPA